MEPTGKKLAVIYVEIEVEFDSFGNETP